MTARTRFVHSTRHAPSADQVHIDLGALDQRVRGAEDAIGNLSEQLNNLSSSFSSQMMRLGEKLDKRLETKPTNWTGFTATAAAVVSVVLALGTAVMIPVFGDIRINGEDINTVRLASATTAEIEQVNKIVKSNDERISQRVDDIAKDKIGLREHEEFKGSIAARISSFEKTEDNRFLDFDKTVVDRFAAIISRLDALSARISEGQGTKQN